MHILLYDHTFEGFLCSVFEIYRLKLKEVCIASSLPATDFLFTVPLHITTNLSQVNRIELHLKKKVSSVFYQNLKKIFITDCQHKERLLLQVIQDIIKNSKNIEDDFTNSNILKVYQLARKIDKEVHRMHAFVRFESINGIYISKVEPDFNVLPLISDHFMKRYADQDWIIFDSKRLYGCAFDRQEVTYFFKEDITDVLKTKSSVPAINQLYESLWKDYMTAVNIPERKNLKLQAQHMPKKYWKNMIENKN